MNSDISPELRGELLDDFYAECDEHLKNIREALSLLEPSQGKAEVRPAVIEELFRDFHSFKGISAIVGLRPAEELSHAAEDYLRELSRGRATLAAHGWDVLMSATQKLEQIVLAFRSERATPEYRTLIESLQHLVGHGPNAITAAAASNASAGAGLDEARAQGRVIWRCTFTPSRELDERGINIHSIRSRLSAVGEIVSEAPKIAGEGRVAFEFVIGMRETPADIASWEKDGLAAELVESNEATEQLGANLPEPEHSPFIAPSHVVRVDLHKLDELMRITGEMVIHRSRLEQFVNGSASGNRDTTLDLPEVNAAMARSLRELRHAIMRIRLVPVAEIFARMPFVVRDLARESKKKVRLTLEGQQTELDKYLIEKLKDPLLHLVRNAFSHAVELPEERLSAGKPEEATITLRARTHADWVLIEISDDGRGIDPKKIARKAAQENITIPADLDSAAILKIICAPGFSTRDDADRESGRGVGMSVVYNTVRDLGGSMALETELGKGTTFTLRLPLTLTVAETLIVSTGNQTCAVPQSFVTEVMQIAEDQVRTVNRVEMVPYRSGVLPLVRLASIFRLPATPRDRSIMLVLSSGRGSTGLVVDRIHGQREVVVRAIRDPLVQMPGIIGATELGDGRPVLILDGAVLTSGAVRPHAEQTAGAKELAIEPAGK